MRRETGHLGAAFFFTFKKYDNPLRLFTSIAFQLTTVLPDYHDAVNERISKDRSLVGKKIPAQFRSLIVEPLQELGKQGKRIQPKAIFIDGLDECAGGDAQAEITKIITSFIKEGSTGLFSAVPNLASCPHSSRTASLLSLILFNSLSLVRQTARSRCIFGANSRTYLNNKIFHNHCHHGQVTTISRCLLMQPMALLRTPLLCCVL